MTAVKRSTSSQDPHLGSGPDQDVSEVSVSDGNTSDSGSLLSDDSALGDDQREVKRASAGGSSLYGVCSRNQPQALRRLLAKGVTRAEVMETDVNGWNGLMIACYKGYLEIVYALHHCPFLDINHQDNEGNTALMIAAQAGHIITVNYLLNYYPGADTEVRDCRGFTALIKAAMQGRNNVVAALIMAGADVNAVDDTKGRSVRDWALKTGRFDTLQRLRRLTLRPVAEQFCESYVCSWPDLPALVARKAASENSGTKITQRLKSTFGFRFPREPQENGVLDHMVRMTSGLRSPLVATGCRPLCPSSPPEAGQRRLAVPELVERHSRKVLEENSVCHWSGSQKVLGESLVCHRDGSQKVLEENSVCHRSGSQKVLEENSVCHRSGSQKVPEENSVCHRNGSKKELEENSAYQRSSLASSIVAPPSMRSSASVANGCCIMEVERRDSLISLAPNGASGGRGFVARSMACKNSVFPSGCVPQIRVSQSGEPTPKKEKKKKRHKGLLEPPKWKYKEMREKRKAEKAEKAEKARTEQEKKKKESKRTHATPP